MLQFNIMVISIIHKILILLKITRTFSMLSKENQRLSIFLNNKNDTKFKDIDNVFR